MPVAPELNALTSSVNAVAMLVGAGVVGALDIVGAVVVVVGLGDGAPSTHTLKPGRVSA